MSNDTGDDDATPSLSSNTKTKPVLRMNTPANSGSEISSHQSETRWSAIRKLQSSIKTPLMKGGVNNNIFLLDVSKTETNQGKNGVVSSQKNTNNNSNKKQHRYHRPRLPFLKKAKPKK